MKCRMKIKTKRYSKHERVRINVLIYTIIKLYSKPQGFGVHFQSN